MTDDDRMLEQALADLPEPGLPPALAARLAAIPERGVVRRFPLRAWRVSALGWAAAAAIGVFIGTQWSGEDAESLASGETAAESAPAATTSEADVELVDANEADDLALATGSFTEFGEEP